MTRISRFFREKYSLRMKALNARPLPQFLKLAIATSPLLKQLTTLEFEGIQFDVLYYGLCMLLVLLRPTILFSRKPIALFLFACCSLVPSSLCGVQHGIRVGIELISLWVLYAATIRLIEEGEAENLFLLYVKASSVVAVWGIFELIFGYTNGLGLDGFSFESSHYVVTCAPAAYFALASKTSSSFQKFILPTSLLLTFSATGLLVSAIIFATRIRRQLPAVLALTAGLYVLWSMNEPMRQRVSLRLADIGLAWDHDKHDFGSNRTTASWVSNRSVALSNMEEFFPFGIGYSNHAAGYDRFFKNSPFESSIFYGTNSRSGHSLLFRFLSEFGALGALLLSVSGFLAARKMEAYDILTKTVFWSCSAHLIGKAMKLGSYLDYGTPFFLGIMLVILFRDHR